MNSADRDPIDLLAEDFVRRHRRGESPSVTEYARRHPDLADAIRETLPAALMLERLKPVSGDLSSSTGPRTVAGTKLERLGDYRILREVGRGGMGVVYEAEQESLGRRVALKVLSHHAGLGETTLRRFALEAKAAARLHHTNIVPVFGVGEADGVHYYVMQFIRGQGLDAVLSEIRRLRRQRQKSTPHSPSPGTPGEGGGEGSASEISNDKSEISNAEDPHPDPLPEYREREKGGGGSPVVLRSFRATPPDPAPSPIRSGGITFSIDDRFLVTWGGTAAEVWDVETGSPRYAPLRHDGRCFDARFSPDGRHLATAGFDGTARVWDFETGKPAAAPLAHGGNAVFSLRFVPPDGRLLLTNSNDGAVRLWDWQANRLEAPPTTDEVFTYAGALTEVGRWVITGSGNDAVRVLDRSTGHPVTPAMRVSGPWSIEVTTTPGGKRFAAVAGAGDAVDLYRLDDLYAATPTSSAEALTRWGELVSGQRLDGAVVRALTSQEWWERWTVRHSDHRPPSPGIPGEGGGEGSESEITWHRQRATVARAAGDGAAALFHLARLTAAGAADDSEWEACARESRRLGKWSDAARCFAEVVKRRPRDTELRIDAGETLLALRRKDDGAREFTTAAKLHAAGGDRPWVSGNWWAVGPYPYAGNIERPLPPETADDLIAPLAPHDGATGAPLRWRSLDTRGPWMNFDSIFGSARDAVGYARQVIFLPGDAPRHARLSIGTDDLGVLWLNDEQIYAYDTAPRLATPGDGEVAVTLRPGFNTLLAKVVNVTGGAKLYAEFLPVAD